jgi:hypothetical protein
LLNIPPILRGLGDVLRLVWFLKMLKRRAVSRAAIMRLKIDVEQPGRPTNRIRLSESVDAIGMRKAIIEWSIGTIEREAGRSFAAAIKSDLEMAGLPPLDWSPDTLTGELPIAAGHLPPDGRPENGKRPCC